MMEQLPPYEQWLKDRLTRWERFAEVFSPTDERLDYIAMALQLVAQQLATPVDGRIASAVERLSLVETKIDALIDATERLSLVGYPSVAHWGTARGGKDTKLIDETAYWQDNIWTGYEVAIIAGTGIGQIRKIESNDIQSLTVEAEWTTDLDNTSVYVIRRRRGIDFEAQSMGVYLQPEWAALQAVDKNFTGLIADVDFGETVYIEYRVPAGKTLYITDVAAACAAHNAVDGDLPQHFWAYLANVSTTGFLTRLGGNGGMAIVYNKPKVFLAGESMRFCAGSAAKHAVRLYSSCGGYEI